MSWLHRHVLASLFAASLAGCADRTPALGSRAPEWGPPVGAEVEGWAWSVRLATPVGRPTEPYLGVVLPIVVDAWRGCSTSSTATPAREAAIELTLEGGRVAAAKVREGGVAAGCLAEGLAGRAVAGEDVHLMVGLLPKAGSGR